MPATHVYAIATDLLTYLDEKVLRKGRGTWTGWDTYLFFSFLVSAARWLKSLVLVVGKRTSSPTLTSFYHLSSAVLSLR